MGKKEEKLSYVSAEIYIIMNANKEQILKCAFKVINSKQNIQTAHNA